MTEILITDSLGREWRTNACLHHGDYCSGGGVLARSNIKVLLERDDHKDTFEYFDGNDGCEIAPETTLIIHECAYTYQAVFLLRDDPTWEALENYPALNEEAMTELEVAEQFEAWESWVETDFKAGITWDMLGFDDDDDDDRPDGFDWRDDAWEYVVDLTGECTLIELFHQAAERANEYWQEDANAQWIDIPRVLESFEEIWCEFMSSKPYRDAEAAGQLTLNLS